MSKLFSELTKNFSEERKERIRQNVQMQLNEILKGNNMNEQDIENEIVAKGLTAPRVTLQGIKDKIKHVEYVKHVSYTGQILRWCIITMANGFAVTGNPSVAVSSENDNEELGEKISYDNTFDEIWKLEGYALKEKLSKS